MSDEQLRISLLQIRDQLRCAMKYVPDDGMARHHIDTALRAMTRIETSTESDPVDAQKAAMR